MHADIKIIDPIWTSAYNVRNYGYMVYDTLLARDKQGLLRGFDDEVRGHLTKTLQNKGLKVRLGHGMADNSSHSG